MTKATPPSLFLLGGHDLEMKEIRKLLEKQGCTALRDDEARSGTFTGCRYVDRDLSWGAKTSDYADLIETFGSSNEITIYGIELTEDIELPNNYHRIDHHNDLADRPSSLEQVAEIFDAKLDRWQELVAANDKGYIPAMQALCATDQEIERIRWADRKAQGVTPEEEKAAEELARCCSTCDETESPCQKLNGFYRVQTDLEHFSPLVDRLFFVGKWPILVYNPEKKTLSFSGRSDQIRKLAESFSDAIEAKEAWHGGNPPGYFGIAPEYLESHDLEETLERISKILEVEERKEELHSYHILMFPFVHKRIDEESAIDETHWSHVKFSLDSKENYNEYIYFHDFVRDVLYEPEGGDPDTQISKYYEYKKERGEYIVSVHGTRYILDLDGIALRHFKNGVGILSFHLKNTRYPHFNDILKINDFGRRIFPQYLGEKMVDDTKGNLLACSLELVFEGDAPMIERFDFYRSFDRIKQIPEQGIHLPIFIETLLAEAYGSSAEIEPIIDDRMYTLCHYMNDAKSERLTRYDEKESRYVYECDADWHRFVFVDGGSTTCQNRTMLSRLIEQSTYPRWSDYGTLYGVTRYSFMLLTKNDWFAQNILNLHIRTMYYQMATLLLAYRAMILHFSDRVTATLKSADGAQELQKDYLEFTNRIYFKELTAQEQGIELFDLARKQMRLDHHLRELDHDINELNSFKQMELDREQMELDGEINDQGHKLNTLAALFLPATVVSGLMGMNVLPKWLTECDLGVKLTLVLVFIVLLTYLTLKMVPGSIQTLKTMLSNLYTDKNPQKDSHG